MSSGEEDADGGEAAIELKYAKTTGDIAATSASLAPVPPTISLSAPEKGHAEAPPTITVAAPAAGPSASMRRAAADSLSRMRSQRTSSDAVFLWAGWRRR